LIGGIRVSKQRRPLSRGVGHFGNFSAQNETALLGGPGEAAMGVACRAPAREGDAF
jgi:hypothetical protein